MSISDLSAHRHGPAGLLADATALVREAAEAMYAAQSDEDLVTAVELVAQLRSAAAAVEAGRWPRPTTATWPSSNCSSGRPGSG